MYVCVRTFVRLKLAPCRPVDRLSGELGLIIDRCDAIDVAVDRPAILVKRWLAPSTWVIAPRRARWDWRVQSCDFERRVGWRRAVALHTDQPRRRGIGWDRERVLEFVRQIARPLLAQVGLELFAFVVELAKARHLWLGLVLEEGVVELLVVNVNLAHLGLDPLACLLLERRALLLLFDRVALCRDPRVGNEGGQLERRLLDASLALEVVALLGPVLRDRDCVPVRLDLDKQLRVCSRRVDPVDHLGLAHEALQVGDGQARELLELAL